VNSLRTLFNRLPLSSIRSRMLIIALLPAMLTEFGMVAYFTKQTLATAEASLHTRARNAARHLAAALPYALASGNTAYLDTLLSDETQNSRLLFVRVTDARGQSVAQTAGAEPTPIPISCNAPKFVFQAPGLSIAPTPPSPPIPCSDMRKSGCRSTKSAHSSETPCSMPHC
jgi:Tfp pilus assembly protein PilE